MCTVDRDEEIHVEPLSGPSHNGLRVTQITFRAADEYANDKLVGYARITLNDCFTVWTRIVRLGDRVVLQFPNRRTHAGALLDTANPATAACRVWIESVVLGHWAATQREEVI